MKAFLAILCISILSGCAGPRITSPIDVKSDLVHGADSTQPVSNIQLQFASRCLGGTEPKFWARYFNQTNLPERANRASYSFVPERERATLIAKEIRLLPVFAQNRNNRAEIDARVHGVVNASDLIRTVGVRTLISHLEAGPLMVVLNEETPGEAVLTPEHYKGWVDGFSGTLTAIGANAKNLLPIIYGNVQLDPKLKTVLRELYQNREMIPYGGFWRARTDPSLQRMPTAENCGKLADWSIKMDDWDESVQGPIYIRQYVLDANGTGNALIDLNALNPIYAQRLLSYMLLLRN